jgi:hypothetical protein
MPIVHLPLDAIVDDTTVLDHWEIEDDLDDGDCADSAGYYNLCSNSEVSRTVFISGDAGDRHLFMVRTYGVPAIGVYPLIALDVDSEEVRQEVVSAPAGAPIVIDQEVTLVPGDHEFSVRFLNDYYMPPENRDVFLDWFEVRSVGEGARVVDLISGSLDGTLRGAGEVEGRIAGGLAFDGVDDSLTVEASADLDLSGRYSVALWLRPTDPNRRASILALDANPRAGIALEDGAIIVTPYGDGTPDAARYEVQSAAGVVQADRFQHLALVVDGVDVRVLLDGSPIVERTLPGTLAASGHRSELVLARSFDDSSPAHFEGVLDDVRIYDVPLDDAAVEAVLAR